MILHHIFVGQAIAAMAMHVTTAMIGAGSFAARENRSSNDPLLGGDPLLYNPEDLLITALSSCHMLWFLHLSFNSGIVVTGYEDHPIGHGESASSGAGRFVAATLRPQITLAPGMDAQAADAVHDQIHDVCFIARSVNFPVRITAQYDFAEI
ncbi:hypothetical protein IMCC1933_13060 [Rhodobacteraceae bacterium IMCC1933]|nr:hypothetical protein [Rhodobacteraceae bacterium IMCC1923]MDP4067760.1 hypothetical protein [Rhodobacteraceae bacterium IMCC1933]MDP4070960.1 hypothetical protein [Rhodobacteraceae bacterium IMCC1909]